jgi:uncharacterized protein YidB (DUF937 family)
MGLLDSVMGAVAAEVQGQGQGGLGDVLGSLLAQNGELGGLSGLVEKFNQAGLGNVVSSWIGHGENLPVSGEQLASVLGSGTLGAMANKLGLDTSALSGQLAHALPGLVDQLTPNGALPEAGVGQAGDLMGMLGGLLKG